MDTPVILQWVFFLALVAGLLALDLGVFHRRAHAVHLKEALGWSAFWILLAITFGVGVYLRMGSEKALEYFTGYLIEKALSVDNIFVFVMIFSYFAVPDMYQHRVLFWGIIGALIMRAIFIAAGVTLIELFHWVIYVFGAFLVLTGIRMALQEEKEIHPERNPVIRLARQIFPISDQYEDDSGKFFVTRAGRRLATPLFIVLLMVESTDLIFAIDSIPAILAITQDPFIVYTSNVFAILGLRALYFALAGIMGYFRYLRYGLSVVLVFVGLKMIISDFYKIPVAVALGIVAGILLVSIIASLLRPVVPQPGLASVNPPSKEKEDSSANRE